MVADAADRSAIYVGWLRHRRMTPVAHEFTYPLFMMLLDIDRIPALMQRSWLTGYNRWNVAAFYDRDHSGDPSASLRHRVEADAAAAGLALPDGQILLLTHLRYLGYCFNPVSFYYCFDRAGVLRQVMAEVSNTYGERRNYWLTPDAAAQGSETSASRFMATASKGLYVSPFMAPDLAYGFRLGEPGPHLVVHMTVSEPRHATKIFDATLSMTRRPWTAPELRSTLWRYPLMTAKVMAAIHWEALKLWRKGVPAVPRVVTR